MKYPQSVPMPRDVEDWLEGELKARGIDAVVYTRYILSLMQQDTLDFELVDIWLNRSSAESVWNKHERKQLDEWQSKDHTVLKRLAVMRCLLSATGQKYQIDSLVEELCAKLKDIKSSAPIQEPTFLQPCEIPTDYKTMLPPQQGKFKDRGTVDESFVTSAWTRGILRASLDTTDTALPYYDTIKAQEFPMIYQGARGMFDGYIEMLTEKAPLPEDLPFYNNHITDHCFGTSKRIDSPWDLLDAAVKRGTFKQNQAFFYDNNKLFSSADFVQAQTKQAEPPFFPAWSLGGPTNTLPNHNPDGSCFREVTRKVAVDEKQQDNVELPNTAVEEEDLLTSARTHFRPIHSDDSTTRGPVYADGTTFAISTQLTLMPFERSESGTLFLETGKYMEYKDEDENRKPGVEAFIPKFKVRQSNEKFCQTEDVAIMAEMCQQVVPASSASSESDPDEFYFPGDDILALHLNVDEVPAEREVEQIVSGRLDVRWKVLSKTPVVDEHDMEPNWESNNEALVNQLVDEGPAWESAYCELSQDDDCMEGVVAENDATSLLCWPQLTDSIWNPKSRVCDTCKGPNSSEDTQNLMAKNEWQGIWGQPICDDCKEDAAFGSVVAAEDVDGKNAKNSSIDWSQFGPIGVKMPQKDGTDSFWKWPDLGAALTTYLEESRLRAFEMLHVWSPLDISTDFDVARKPCESDLRGLWDPLTPDNCRNMTECREIWSPLSDNQPNHIGAVQRPRTYSMLRAELSDDCDQLLSDLSDLHLQQLNADTADSLENDAFPVAPSCPPGHFVNIVANWKLVIDDKDLGLLEQPYNSEIAQKERKRRHSSSQKMCELYKKGECRRPHCRFMHGDDAIPSPFLASFAPNVFRGGHELQRAFTL